MRVAQLLKILQNSNPDMEVVVRTGQGRKTAKIAGVDIGCVTPSGSGVSLSTSDKVRAASVNKIQIFIA